jgi:hypothetical protein
LQNQNTGFSGTFYFRLSDGSENMGLNGEYLLGVRKSDYQSLIEKLSAFHLIEIL